MRVLVVEDEQGIREVLKLYLEKEGYESYFAEDGEKALTLFDEIYPDFILLDLMLPKISGEEVCKKIRKTSNIPIIMITAKDQEIHRLKGLEIGADDYVLKPFSPKEVMMRIKAIWRRTGLQNETKLVYDEGKFVMDEASYKLWIENREVDLTKNEFKILWTLAKNPERTYSREQIIELSFSIDFEGFDRTIDVHIKNIRKKIEEISTKKTKPIYIHTVYGIGYMFKKEW